MASQMIRETVMELTDRVLGPYEDGEEHCEMCGLADCDCEPVEWGDSDTSAEMWSAVRS